MKAYIIILAFVLLFMWLWKPMLIARVIWYLLRRIAQHINNHDVIEGE
jgi:hypothetical protein